MMKKNMPQSPDLQEFKVFVQEIKSKILSSQYEALKKVNKELISLYWNIGEDIVLKQEKYNWGKSVVKNLSAELQKEFVGMKGFSSQNLWNMRQFYLEYKKNEKLQTLSREIGWSHNQTNFDDVLPEKYNYQAKLAVKDEYNFDFLELSADYSEYELEIGKFKPEYAGKKSLVNFLIENNGDESL